MTAAHQEIGRFCLQETTIAGIQRAFADGSLTARQLVELYLNRIEAYDRNGPEINSIITVNPQALEDADRLDRDFGNNGLTGPLHGVPVILKDQMDARGMPTTLGSVVFRDYFPDRDCFVTEKLRQAGAIILAKATLGELGRGDTHGSLFGSTKTLMTWTGRPADLREVPEPAYRPIWARLPSARRVSLPSGDRPLGTALPASGRLPVWSAGEGSTPAGRGSQGPWVP